MADRDPDLGLPGLRLGGGDELPPPTSSPSSPPGAYLDPEGELQKLIGPGHQVVKVIS